MLRSATKMGHLCKEFLISDIKNLCNSSSTGSMVNQVFEKYFYDRVNTIREVDNDSDEQFQRMLDMRTNQKLIIPPSPEDVWIFGYGSLVWKADFPYIDRLRGFICGYQRRFYQHSIDHRGTPTKPGRVVTLLPTGINNHRVYGVAYRIAAEQKKDVLNHLDYREKNGYERCKLQFHEFPEETGTCFDIIMYVATQENESYAGEVWEVSRIAEQIFTSAGPSGPNRDYLFNLANAMRMLFPNVEDNHLFALEHEVLKLVETEEIILLERALKRHIAEIIATTVEIDVNELNTEKAAEELNQLIGECANVGWKEALLTTEMYADKKS